MRCTREKFFPGILTGLALLMVVGMASATNLVVDNFNDANFTLGTEWKVGDSSGGAWGVAKVESNIYNELELTNSNLLNTFDYQPVPHYIETTFDEVSLPAFSLTTNVGFRDLQGGANHDNNALGFALLDAAGTSGYSVEFSSRPSATGWFGMNIRRVDNGIYTETADLDGRLAAIANGFTRTYTASGAIATQSAGVDLPDDNRFNLTFTRSGSDLAFTIAGANLTTASRTIRVTDPHAGGALTSVARLRAYGTDPGYSYAFDDIVLTDGGPRQPRSSTFGRQWLRENPFVVMGAAYGDGNPPLTVPFDRERYLGMNLSAVFANKNFAVSEAAAAAGVPWHQHFATGPRGNYEPYSDGHKVLINELINRGDGTAWMLPDEPQNESDHQALAQSARWLNEDHPEMLVYITVSNGNTIAQLNHIVDTIKPDAMFFNNYPFRANGSTNLNGWFSELTRTRQVGLAHQIPFGGWMQSYQFNGADVRTPSESDTRFNGFTLLTAGYTMLNYYTYDHGAGSDTSTLLDLNGNPTAHYYHAAAANLEYARVGKSLRFLINSGVGFVSGGVGSTPTGLSNWASGAGGDANILAISANNTNSSSIKDGLIGFFTDDDDDRYFMLTNLYHGGTLSASAASIEFSMTFANGIDAIYRLSRLTGAPERVDIIDGMLVLTLAGGTGDLFKYDNGYFTGILPGDANLDDVVDLHDLVTLATSYGLTNQGTWLTGDFDLDDDVDLADLTILATHYDAGTAQAVADLQSIHSVPEPAASLSLLAFAGLLRQRTTRQINFFLPGGFLT